MAPDMAAISGVFSSISGMKTIAEGLLAIRDISVVTSKVAELNSKIIDVQQGLFQLQEERRTLIEKNSSLEKQITDFENWEVEKEKYELVQVAPGAFGYMEKLNGKNTNPPHWLCTTCFENRRKSIFQPTNAISFSVYQCVPCGTKFTTRHNYGPDDTERRSISMGNL